jgi:predicted Zn-dependent protease
MSTLAAAYFDGRSARAHPVRLRCEGEQLHIDGDGIARAVPLRQVRWPERTRHGVRVAELPDGAAVQCDDAAAWDLFAQACGRGDSLVVRAQQSWRWVLASALVTVALLGAAYQWGVPWAAQATLAIVPEEIDESIGEAALESIDETLMQPSALPEEQQDALRDAFDRAVAAQPEGSIPPYRIEFRRSKIGPNAFALPGGTIVMTDELVKLVDGDEAVIVGVLGHELGHVRERHGMRMLLQASAIGVIASIVVGDFNSLLAAAPVVLGQAAYSRDAEREADAESARILKGAGLPPAAMVTFFEKIAAKRGDGPSLGIAIASHPADAERIRFFRDYR